MRIAEEARDVIFGFIERLYPWAMPARDNVLVFEYFFHTNAGVVNAPPTKIEYNAPCIRCQNLVLVFDQYKSNVFVATHYGASTTFERPSIGKQVFHTTSKRILMLTWIKIQEWIARECSRIPTFDVLEEMGREKPGQKNSKAKQT